MERMIEASWWRTLPDARIQCLLCPHSCILKEGAWGHCHARMCSGNTLTLPYYGWISSIAIDPIEKKPLRRFMPGTWTYSVGFWHCTMDCPFCQNWEIAHPERIERQFIPPERLARMALDSGCPSISFTYSEPTLHIEYVMNAMEESRRLGLKTILVTNGNILEEPARAILSLTDATNVDLKTSDPLRYRRILGGDLQTVKNFIQYAAELCHVEVTSLAVPGIFDSKEQAEEIASFIASISPAIPLHVTWYRPARSYFEPPLSPQHIRAMAIAAKSRLQWVYN